MLSYVSKEVDRVKELFRGKETTLTEEREQAVRGLAACRAELAECRQRHEAATGESAAKLQVGSDGPCFLLYLVQLLCTGVCGHAFWLWVYLQSRVLHCLGPAFISWQSR